MITLKQRVTEYLEAQRLYYGDKEVDETLEVLKWQSEDLSNMGALSRMFLLRLIDDKTIFEAIETGRFKQNKI